MYFPATFLGKLQSMILKFICHGGGARIGIEYLNLPNWEGGQELPNFRDFCVSAQTEMAVWKQELEESMLDYTLAELIYCRKEGRTIGIPYYQRQILTVPNCIETNYGETRDRLHPIYATTAKYHRPE